MMTLNSKFTFIPYSMKKLQLLAAISVWVLTGLNVAHAVSPHQQHLNCKKTDIPKVIKPMANWDIIATNTGTIHAATIFSGKNLTYSISTRPTNSNNSVTINKTTGTIRIQAEKQDNFDITVKAKNACGTASNKFNVEIDEEV